MNIAAIPHGGGGLYVGTGFSGAVQGQWTNADTVYDLKGKSTSIGASLGNLYGVTGEYIEGDTYSGFNFGAFIGRQGLLPASVHRNVEYAKVYGTNLLGASKNKPCH